MVKHKVKKIVINPDVGHEDPDIEYQSEFPSKISTNESGNEWDADGEFADMDFRLVDDE